MTIALILEDRALHLTPNHAAVLQQRIKLMRLQQGRKLIKVDEIPKVDDIVSYLAAGSMAVGVVSYVIQNLRNTGADYCVFVDNLDE